MKKIAAQTDLLSELSETEFITLLGSIYEHSPWVAEQLWQQQKAFPKGYFDDMNQVRLALYDMVEASTDEQKLILLRAHPDLAGKAALAGDLTEASQSEQTGAGLDQCTAQELAHFLQRNDAYREKFGFPFIMAVKGATKEQILAGFEARTPNDWQTEFDTAMLEVHKIAGFRLMNL